MARADTYTWLPLDEWARLMGYNLWHFNGIDIGTNPSGVEGYECSGYWVQYPYQDERVTRDELAEAIRMAEEIITGFTGFNLLPDWERDVINPPRHYEALYKSNVTPRNTPKSAQLAKRHVIAGGRRSKTLIEAAATITRVDQDGDDYDETAMVTVTTDVNVNEIRVYYPDEEGDDAWEIRPLKVIQNGSSVTITFPVYQAVKRTHIEGISVLPLDGADSTIYLATVDVYRVYNDTTTQVNVVYSPDSEGCAELETACQEISYGNCLYVRDHELGYVVYNPLLREEPDKLEVYSYSGWRGTRVARPDVDLDPYWKNAVAYFAAALLDKEVRNCCGANNNMLVSRWRAELDKRESGKPNYVTTMGILENEFGLATRGAWFAYQRAKAKKVT